MLKGIIGNFTIYKCKSLPITEKDCDMLTHPMPVFTVLEFGFQNTQLTGRHCMKTLYSCTIIQAPGQAQLVENWF